MRIVDRHLPRVLVGLLVFLLLPAVSAAEPLSGEIRRAAPAEKQAPNFAPQGAAALIPILGSIGQAVIGADVIKEAGGIRAGVWHLVANPYLISAPLPNVATGFAMQQNFPNPFQHTTQIGFAVPTRERTTLRVYDVTGRVVSTLVDRVLDPGNYEVLVTAQALSPGIYFYRLQSADDAVTRKLLLLDSSPSAN